MTGWSCCHHGGPQKVVQSVNPVQASHKPPNKVHGVTEGRGSSIISMLISDAGMSCAATGSPSRRTPRRRLSAVR